METNMTPTEDKPVMAPGNGQKVVVGMSGGVDSSVAAFLLKEAGYEVVGVTMNVWPKDSREQIERKGGCCGLSDIEDARRVAGKLGIDYQVLNFREDFKAQVIDNFVSEYQKGRTPNPCIACNRYVKWQTLFTRSIPMGADYIATGHYAKKIYNPDTNRYTIQMIEEHGKDQSYALYNLSQAQLAKTLFPIGDYAKPAIREIAMGIDYVTSTKPDSQDICFIPDNNYGKFLETQIPDDITPGDFLDVSGKVIGQHKGIVYYTVGQRKNLGISFGKPMYVRQINPADNTVVLATDHQLYSEGLTALDINYMYLDSVPEPLRVLAKIRYSHKPVPATISVTAGVLTCHFDEPQRAITPGQAAVFYDAQGLLLCGGTIDQAIMA